MALEPSKEITTEDYFRELYSRCSTGQIVLVGRDKKVSAVFDVTELEDAASHVNENPLELYVKVNPMDYAAVKQRNPFGVGGVKEVTEIIGFHYDVDAAKDDKYLDQQKMLDALDAMPVQPSAIILTNGESGGFHAYWWLKTPIRIESEEQRADLQAVSNRWLAELREHARPGSVDSTANLDRLLRPIGSTRKSGNTVQALRWHPERRYTLDQFRLAPLPQDAPEATYEPTSGDKVVAEYLKAVGEYDPAFLLERYAGYSRSGQFLTRPGSQSGSPTCELYEANGTSGATFKSGACEPFTALNASGTNGRWYSTEAIYVTLVHDGDWKKAAAHCHRYFDKQRGTLDIDFENLNRDREDKSEEATAATKPLEPVSVVALQRNHPSLRQPVVHGILRTGETANIIASPKIGKSFLAGNLAWCVATGRPWLSHDVEQGRALILDNELHPETLASRLTHIADEMHVSMDERDQLDVISLRGRLTSIDALEFTATIEPGKYSLIVLDALYRTIPSGVSENDNAGMMAVYNHLDKLAARWQTAIVIVHHSSKGNQGDKSLTDVGAGAGSISRAADTHIAIRPHENEGHAVLEAVTRSFKSPEPISIKFDWPLWTATTLPPEVKRPGRKDAEKQAIEDKRTMAELLELIPEGERGIRQQTLIEKSGYGVSKVKRLMGMICKAGNAELKRRKKRGSSKANVFYKRVVSHTSSGSSSDSSSESF